MTDYTFSTILCPGGVEVVLFYLIALAVLPLTVGVGFTVALVKLIKEGRKQ